METNQNNWTDSQRNAVEGCRVLFPYLSFHERMVWTERLKPLFNHDFAACAKYLTDTKEYREL